MNLPRCPLRTTPGIITAGRFPMPASNSGRTYLQDRFALHQHLYGGTIVIGKKPFAFQAGDLTISPPGVPTLYDLPRGGTHWCIHFEVSSPGPADAGFPLPLHLPSAGSRAHFEEKFRSITETLRPRGGKRTGVNLALAAAGAELQQLLLMMARSRLPRGKNKGRANRRSDHALETARQTMEQHFQQELDVASLAAASGLSRNFFAARFRERYGMTVDGYLLHLRMQMARNLLLSTTLSIKEVAWECGISDPNYFNKQFRRVTGMSPSLYRAH
jgi:AraC-like DNA-binding protein